MTISMTLTKHDLVVRISDETRLNRKHVLDVEAM
jgi:hypothetical protein